MKLASTSDQFLVIAALTLLTVSECMARRRGNSKRANVTSNSEREGKVFSLFSIVTFNNEGCGSSATLSGGGGNRNGTCFTAAECATKGGAAAGSCAAGFGVCCVFTLDSTSGTSVSQNCTYIQNPGFPSMTTATNALTYTINKCSPDVCYLRLDFEIFTLQGIGATDAVDEGVCMDTFTVTSPPSGTIPTICGENAGAHIYVDMGAGAADTATLNFGFVGAATNRQWDIKVTQVECSNPSSPPNGCLQYLVGLTGRITTFNFSPAADNHLNNQEYSVCIRQEAGHCCVEYMICQGETMPFSLQSDVAVAKQDTDCTADYILISTSGSMCNQGTNNLSVDSKFCGSVFSTFAGAAAMFDTPVCDCTAPFAVDIFTDEFADGFAASPGQNAVAPSRGVCLEWEQVPCSN